MRAIALCLVVLLAGCSSVLQRVNVPVPVGCLAVEPVRPVMPTAALEQGVAIDSFIAAAQAELALRDAYEDELRAALRECIAPISNLTDLS